MQWTVDQPQHMPIIDIVLGPWGEGATPKDRMLVSLLYQPRPGGGSFMIGSGKGRRADSRTLCDRALERGEVVGTPAAKDAFSMVDSLWLTEPRIDEIRTLDSIVQSEA